MNGTLAKIGCDSQLACTIKSSSRSNQYGRVNSQSTEKLVCIILFFTSQLIIAKKSYDARSCRFIRTDSFGQCLSSLFFSHCTFMVRLIFVCYLHRLIFSVNCFIYFIFIFVSFMLIYLFQVSVTRLDQPLQFSELLFNLYTE